MLFNAAGGECGGRVDGERRVRDAAERTSEGGLVEVGGEHACSGRTGVLRAEDKAHVGRSGWGPDEIKSKITRFTHSIFFCNS